MSEQIFKYRGIGGLAICSVLALAACGGGGGGGTSLTDGDGTLTVAVTDAPVDDAQEVWIEFTDVDVHGADGTTHHFTLSPAKRINLLTLSDGTSVKLLDDEILPAGDYSWIRLYVDEDNSSIVDSMGGEHCMRIPSNANTGLKLNRGFTLDSNGVANFVIDFDLRKSIHAPGGQACYQMRPTLRIVDASISGSIAGSIDPALYAESPCAENFAVGEYGAVYVYTGPGAVPDDVGGAGEQPLASAQVVETEIQDDPNTIENEESTTYTYLVPYLDAGTYTVAFACDAVNDDPGLDDDIGFYAPADVDVFNDTITEHDFVAPVI